MPNDHVESVTLQVSDIVMRVDGHWLRNYAGDFLNAAKHFVPPSNRFSPVQYYLVCHSIELSLKAFLFSAGFNKAARKSLNHNLETAINEAEANGLSAHLQVSAKERDLIRRANRLYPKKEFEYFESLETIYDPHDFQLDELTCFAQTLFEAIEAPVRASVLK
jgi:hypothetical protein